MQIISQAVKIKIMKIIQVIVKTQLHTFWIKHDLALDMAVSAAIVMVDYT